MTNWGFLDPIAWDYNVATPHERRLGGSQSGLCYLAAALAKRGHGVVTLTCTTAPREVAGVRCLSLPQIPNALFTAPATVLVALNSPSEVAAQLRLAIPRSVPLILWTQHA